MSYPTKPGDWFTTSPPGGGGWDWGEFLQAHLTSSSVRVKALHPIAGLRWAAWFTAVKARGDAGRVSILSGVRTYAEQAYLNATLCDTCAADPDYPRGWDAEGIKRVGSNHQEQPQPWGAACGYAVDLNGSAYYTRADIMAELDAYGLPMTVFSPLERWHREPGWMNGWAYAAALPNGGFPTRPGVYRPLSRNLKGGDVGALQVQLKITKDDSYGAMTEQAVAAWQRANKRPATGAWTLADQLAYEKGPAVPITPNTDQMIHKAEEAAQQALTLARGAKAANVGNPTREKALADAIVAAKALRKALDAADDAA